MYANFFFVCEMHLNKGIWKCLENTGLDNMNTVPSWQHFQSLQVLTEDYYSANMKRNICHFPNSHFHRIFSLVFHRVGISRAALGNTIGTGPGIETSKEQMTRRHLLKCLHNKRDSVSINSARPAPKAAESHQFLFHSFRSRWFPPCFHCDCIWNHWLRVTGCVTPPFPWCVLAVSAAVNNKNNNTSWSKNLQKIIKKLLFEHQL